jgi:repressor LexA
MVKSAAYRYIMLLKERGFIEYSGKGTMRLTNDSTYYKKYRSVKVPIYGSVICGTPEEEEQQNPEYLALPEEWITGECFLLRAKGDSMTGIGVNDGDLVLVKREYGSPAEYNGKVIVALTEDGNTLKRLFIDNGRPRLHPENKRYKDIYPQRLEMQGLALRVIKQIE